MSALVATLTSLPYTQFRRNKHFYLWYDAFFLVVFGSAVAVMWQTGWTGITTEWDPRLLLFSPIAAHILILAGVWVHNASHGNFPRPINRIMGEICGVIILTRFASWEIVHQRHHKYSDDAEADPHPITPDARGYWAYAWKMVVQVEKVLQDIFFEMYGGKTKGNQRYQKWRATLSFGVTYVLMPIFWFTLLGAPAFVMLFIPASIAGVLHLIHFNWSTHNPWSPDGDHRPVNLNHGFYRVGNWLWHGIYWHGNHHKSAGLFNPGDMPAHKALPIIRPGDRTDHYPAKKVRKKKAA